MKVSRVTSSLQPTDVADKSSIARAATILNITCRTENGPLATIAIAGNSLLHPFGSVLNNVTQFKSSTGFHQSSTIVSRTMSGSERTSVQTETYYI